MFREMSNKLIGILCIAYTALLWSCNVQKPVNSSAFIAFDPSKGWYKNTTVVFSLDVDSTHYAYCHNLVFTLQIAETYRYNREDTLLFDLAFLTPTGNMYSDTLRIPVLTWDKNVKLRKSNGVIEFEIPYATNIGNMETGRWTIRINKCSQTDNNSGDYGGYNSSKNSHADLYKEILGIGTYITSNPL